MSVLLLNFITEIISACFLINKMKLDLLYSISFIFHNTLWLLLLFEITSLKKIKTIFIFLFLFFSIYNILFLECTNLNYLTFIFGAILYLIIFIYISFTQLNKENLDFFKSNYYILLFAPILFFLGYSFMFGFRNLKVRDVIIFGNTNLYTLISYFVNIQYYTLINIYIYKERKSLNE